MQRACAELGASFRLHYFAVEAGMLETRVIDGKQPAVDPEVTSFARDLVRGRRLSSLALPSLASQLFAGSARRQRADKSRNAGFARPDG